MTKKIKIFREFVESGGENVINIAKRNRVSARYVYRVVKEIRNGKPVGQNEMMRELMWRSRFKTWCDAIPKNQRRNSVSELGLLVQEMSVSGFSVPQIAKLVDKHPSSIRYHISELKTVENT